MTVFFYDSYAVIEYLNDNPLFVPYFEEHTGILTIFNLVEIYYSVLSEKGKEKADIVFDTLYPITVEPTGDSIKRAMIFRLQHKKKKLSYADCIGYEIARERNILFLTGDIQFEKMDNVKYLK